MTHAAHFAWDVVYLSCFGVGLALSVLAFFSGALHLHGGQLHGGHLHPGHLHAGHLRSGGHGQASATPDTPGHAGQLSPVNGFTAVAFLCWFGGAGYLLTHGGALTWVLVLLLSVLSGLAGSGVVFWFVARVMLPRERALEPADTPIIGVLGRVSAPLPPGGVGEMLYSQGGARRSMPIAAEDGIAIARGAEVVVLRYARGIAYVRRWDEMQQILLGDTPAGQRTDLANE